MQAYQKAKSYYKGNDDYVSLKELKYFFIFLYQYFDYYLAFKSIDSNFDDRVSIKEFKSIGPYLKQFGVSIPDMDIEFKIIDKNKGGYVLFDELASYLIDLSLKSKK